MHKKLLAFALAATMMLSLTACGSSGSSHSSYYEPQYGATADVDGFASIQSDSAMAGGFGIGDIVSGFTNSKSESASISNNYKDMVVEESWAEEEPAETETTNSNTSTEIENPEKLVYRATVEMEVKEFEKSIEAIKARVESFGGITQNERYADNTPWDYYMEGSSYSKISGWKSFSTTIRIPTARFDEFIAGLSEVGHVQNSSSMVENISQAYYSNKAYLDSYNNQLEKLQSMYQYANTIGEMLEIEARISDVQAEINRLTTVITSMDRDVAFSTITLHVEEVTEYSDTPREYEEMNFFEKVWDRFKDSFKNFTYFLEDLLYWFIDAMWYLAILAVFVIFIIKRRRKAKATRVAMYGEPKKDKKSIFNKKVDIGTKEGMKNASDLLDSILEAREKYEIQEDESEELDGQIHLDDEDNK